MQPQATEARVHVLGSYFAYQYTYSSARTSLCHFSNFLSLVRAELKVRTVRTGVPFFVVPASCTSNYR